MARRTVVTTLVTIFALLAILGSGVANAKPSPAPRLALYSEDIFAAGGNSGCRGTIHAAIEVDRAKPGRAFVTLRPRPFAGNGPAWRKNPVCKIRIYSVVDFFHYGWGRIVTAGPRGGAPVRVTIPTGSGLHLLSFGVNGAGVGNGNYIIVP